MKLFVDSRAEVNRVRLQDQFLFFCGSATLARNLDTKIYLGFAASCSNLMLLLLSVVKTTKNRSFKMQFYRL